MMKKDIKSLSFEELQTIWNYANKIQNEYNEMSIAKLYVAIYVPSTYSSYVGDNKCVKIQLRWYDIESGVDFDFYRDYVEDWELLNSGLPVVN